jgi:hypothetical protein
MLHDDPDLAHNPKEPVQETQVQETQAQETQARGNDPASERDARISCEEYYNETAYGMDPSYDPMNFGDLEPDEVAMLNRALNLTSKLMIVTVPEANTVLDSAHERVDELILDEIPF